MAKRNSFRPADTCELETRIVLSHVHPARAASVVARGLNRPTPQQAITTLVSTAYASFTSDYDQARAIYYSNISAASNSAFRLYTAQRVQVLAGQLVSSLLTSPERPIRNPGQADVLPTLITRRVDGTAPTSLLSTLSASIPPAGTTPSATTTLYSLSQDNAIEASELSVINGVVILREGDFGNKSQK